MVHLDGAWIDLAQAAEFAAPLLLLPHGTVNVPRGQLWTYSHKARHTVTVLRHDYKSITVARGEAFPSGTDTPVVLVFDVFAPGALRGNFVMRHKAEMGIAHPVFLAGGVPGEHSVPFVCPACAGIHRHGAGATANGAVLRATHCLSAQAAGIDTAVLIPYAHGDPAAVLTSKEHAWLTRWQRLQGWRADWPGEAPEYLYQSTRHLIGASA